MSGADQEFRAALDAANQRHVAACLAQGGFARIERLPGGRIVHLGPDGGPYREIKGARPLPPGRTGEARVVTLADPVLAKQRPLTLDRVMMDGVRYRPGRVHVLQLLVHGGHDAVTVRSLAVAMGQAEGPVGSLVVAMIGDGLAPRVGSFSGRPRTALYAVTDEGRRVLAKLTAIIDPDPAAVPVLDTREVRVLELFEGGRSLTLVKFSTAIGLGPQAMRKVLGAMTNRGLVKRQDHKQQQRWKASGRGREALVAARASA